MPKSSNLHTLVSQFFFLFLHHFYNVPTNFFPWLLHMDPTLPCYVGFADCASRWSPNLTSTMWLIYSLSHEFIHIDGICVGIPTNNQTRYDGVTSLLTDAIHLGIHHDDVFLYSQFLVSQLNNRYWVCDPCLFTNFFHTKQMVRSFESITFTHVTRTLNNVVDQMANDILEWHIHHHIQEAYKNYIIHQHIIIHTYVTYIIQDFFHHKNTHI